MMMRFRLSRFTSLSPSLLAVFLACSLATTLWSDSGILDLSAARVVSTDYCQHAMTGTATYALSSAVSGTTSGPIDLGLVGCFSFSVTGTGSATIRVWQSNNSTTNTAGTTQTAGTIVAFCRQGNQYAQRCYAWPKKGGRYIWFDVAPMAPVPYAPLGITSTASKTTVFYYTPTNWPN